MYILSIYIFSSVLLSSSRLSITPGGASSKRWSASIKSKPHHWPSWNHYGSRLKLWPKSHVFVKWFRKTIKMSAFCKRLGFSNLSGRGMTCFKKWSLLSSNRLLEKIINWYKPNKIWWNTLDVSNKETPKNSPFYIGVPLNIQPFLPTKRCQIPYHQRAIEVNENISPTSNMLKERRFILLMEEPVPLFAGFFNMPCG